MRLLVSVLAITLSAAVAEAKLEVREIQAAHGQFGPERKSADYVAGDQVYFRYTLSGVRTDDEGRVKAEIVLRLTDVRGEKLLEKETALLALLPLGGDTLTANASIDLEEGFPPGEYELFVEFRDATAAKKTSFRRKFTVKAPEFSLVRVRFAHDDEGKAPAPAGGLVGQNLVIRLRAVGFDRSREMIDTEMRIDVLDAKGRAVMPQPIRAAVRSENPEEVKQVVSVDLSSSLSLNRAGDFTLRITLHDKAGGKKVSFECPLKVSAQ
ncbi:MAG TPA: hypothetical protein VLM40_00460 [Gemmata sp.]|nr:hypothetical protein [Gemmata sp.]